MALSQDKLKGYTKRLLLSRMRILNEHGFFGLLLMHMRFRIDEEVNTAQTDGEAIIFGPKFLEELNDKELDFVLMHEVMHVALQHCMRQKDFDHQIFNIACDIVVNSNILKEQQMQKDAITLRKYGESMHVAPDGKEGYEYSAEQIYHMLDKKMKSQPKNKRNPKDRSDAKYGQPSSNAKGIGSTDEEIWDDHSNWKKAMGNKRLSERWKKHLLDACETIRIRQSSTQQGELPLFAQRMLEELQHPKMDWRTVLNDFIQEEICDYSFFPPDRRFFDSPFFLPDFNEKEDAVEDILFMIDTSGSMSDAMVTAAYSEIKGAIDQFNGRLKGWLGFFDAAVIEPLPFESEEEFQMIRPKGGGGTSFSIIFEYIREQMLDELPVSVIILTDGFAAFPKEEEAMGIPVLWMLNNDYIDPPWGKVVRIQE